MPNFSDNETAGGTWQSLLSEYMPSSIWPSLSTVALSSGKSTRTKKWFPRQRYEKPNVSSDCEIITQKVNNS